jgi:hypothetical protein
MLQKDGMAAGTKAGLTRCSGILLQHNTAEQLTQQQHQGAAAAAAAQAWHMWWHNISSPGRGEQPFKV